MKLLQEQFAEVNTSLLVLLYLFVYIKYYTAHSHIFLDARIFLDTHKESCTPNMFDYLDDKTPKHLIQLLLENKDVLIKQK